MIMVLVGVVKVLMVMDAVMMTVRVALDVMMVFVVVDDSGVGALFRILCSDFESWKRAYLVPANLRRAYSVPGHVVLASFPQQCTEITVAFRR